MANPHSHDSLISTPLICGLYTFVLLSSFSFWCQEWQKLWLNSQKSATAVLTLLFRAWSLGERAWSATSGSSNCSFFLLLKQTRSSEQPWVDGHRANGEHQERFCWFWQTFNTEGFLFGCKTSIPQRSCSLLDYFDSYDKHGMDQTDDLWEEYSRSNLTERPFVIGVK